MLLCVLFHMLLHECRHPCLAVPHEALLMFVCALDPAETSGGKA